MSDGKKAVVLQVIWNRLIAIVEEQAQSLIRTAFSTSVREAGDLSVGVYDEQGRMLAQAVTGTPGHVNSMAAAVAHFIQRFGNDTMRAGDVFITNDPWLGTGHLHDITVVTPVFANGQVIGFSACTAHVVDIGGRGFGADARSVYEEGLRLPLMRLAYRGEFDQGLLSIVRANVREPDQVVGDIYALAACNDIGVRRLNDLLTEFPMISVAEVASFILGRSKAATLARIAELPNGSATHEMLIDGYATPVTLRATVSIEDARILCDYSGTSAADANGINVPLIYTQAYTCYGLKCALIPDVPNNHASLEPFVVSAPAGSILNAIDPAPVSLRHTVGQMLPDTVFGALEQLMPGSVPAEGAGTLCNFQLSIVSESDASERYEVLTFNSGGCGARQDSDGLSATAFPSGVMSVPVEASENAGPVVIWRKELRTDSGGAGRQRGGLGQWMEVGVRDGYRFEFSAMFDRLGSPARGREGGADGASTSLATDDGIPLAGKQKQVIAPGRCVVMGFAGGGGYGKPQQRARQSVIDDLVAGYISRDAAISEYALTGEEISAALGSTDS